MQKKVPGRRHLSDKTTVTSLPSDAERVPRLRGWTPRREMPFSPSRHAEDDGARNLFRPANNGNWICGLCHPCMESRVFLGSLVCHFSAHIPHKPPGKQRKSTVVERPMAGLSLLGVLEGGASKEEALTKMCCHAAATAA